MNSLGLSRHNTLHDIKLSLWDTTQFHDDNYYKTKLDVVCNTVPGIDDANNWQSYELGDGIEWKTTQNFKGKNYCVIAHSTDEFATYEKIDFIVKLTNYADWLRVSSFKSAGVKEDLNNKVAYWDYVDKSEINCPEYDWHLFDMSTMFDYNKTKEQVKILYNLLNYEDFNEDLWAVYYNKYINFHNSLLG